jgi:peptidoglycan/LPS O-acetylase OafA/YrhL
MTSTAYPRTETAPAATRERSFGERLLGLDGLRAIAVIAVILFHLTPGFVVGGYIGVDIFFVISGFLITGLLVRERAAGHIHFGRFWLRRARRLLPALGLVLLVCASAALLIGGDVLVGLRGQLFGAGTFSYNWLDIRRGSGYFNDATPELFRNLWSLAVEEQFYVVWPLVLAVVLLVKSTKFRVGFAIAVAFASLTAMVALYTPGTDSTRVYYGTDTHSFGLAIGAALALLLNTRPASTWTTGARRSVTVIGALAIPALGALAWFMAADATVVYQGGLALVSVLTVFAIAAATQPCATLGRVLDVAPLRWIGKRSYGLYLWHWPVFILLGAALPSFTDDETGLWILGGCAAAITGAVAALSYRYLEEPIRKLGFRAAAAQWWRGIAMTAHPRVRLGVASVAVLALVSLTATVVVVAPHKGSMEIALEQQAAELSDSEQATVEQPPAPPVVVAPVALPTGDQITAIGDSVMVAASPSLEAAYPGIDIRASVSRQFRQGPAIVRKLVKAQKLRPWLLIGLGTNGPVENSYLDKIIAMAGPNTQIVLVNVQAPRGWTKGVNKTLTDYAAAYPNVELADWRTPIRKHLKYLYADKIHPKNAKGGKVYVTAVTDAMTRLIPPPAPVAVAAPVTPVPMTFAPLPDPLARFKSLP